MLNGGLIGMTMQPKIVTAAIAIDGSNVLIARRGQNEKLAGYWEFPGGKLEDGETLQECLTREMLEELGVHAEVSQVLAESIFDYESGSIRLVGLETRIKGDMRLTVHDAFEWVFFERLLEFKLAPADIPIAEIIIQIIRSRQSSA